MGAHPLNLALRFVLEIIGLFTVGLWGWVYGSGISSYLLAGGLPVIFALIWGLFNVPNDPSRSGRAPIKISGWLRLIIEICFFGGSTWAVFDLQYNVTGFIFGGLLVLHYIISYDRVYWLLFLSTKNN